MNGHTSNHLLAVSLASKIIRANEEIDRRSDRPADQEYFHGQVAAAREIAILLGVADRVDEIIARNTK